jgi:hypothetical protein
VEGCTERRLVIALTVALCLTKISPENSGSSNEFRKLRRDSNFGEM